MQTSTATANQELAVSLEHPATLLADHSPSYQTSMGALYQEDCLAWLRQMPSESVHMVFADPPFNLKKDYGTGVGDAMKEDEYLSWSKSWLDESLRVLKPGGALLVFNLPRWCIEYGHHLGERGLKFRHWIACRMPKSMPIFGRMSPSHYGLLYYTKGKPATFNIIRQPVQSCRHCGGEVKDYGGHRDKLHADGLRLQDVFEAPEEVWEEAPFALPAGEAWSRVDEIWEDIPPVRHARYKHRGANALAPLMLERLVAMTTNVGDIVLDPFCGTGTTAYAAEHLKRRWLSAELGDIQPAIHRLEDHAAGLHARWETGRGKGRAKKKVTGKVARKKREESTADAPELPFASKVPDLAREL